MSRRNLEKTQPRPLKADAMFSRKCSRTRYATPVDARIALGRLPEGKTIRKCPECGGYHIVEPGVLLRPRGKEARGARSTSSNGAWTPTVRTPAPTSGPKHSTR